MREGSRRLSILVRQPPILFFSICGCPAWTASMCSRISRLCIRSAGNHSLGHEIAGDREEAIRYGAFDFVRKPADIELLAGKIKEAYWMKIEQPATDFLHGEAIG